MAQALSPITADVEALNEVATVLWEARALYDTVFHFMTEDEWLDPLADLVAARGRWCVHLRERVETLGQTVAQSLMTTIFDELNIEICRCLIEGDLAGAIQRIDLCEERLREAVRQQLDNPRLTPAAIEPLTRALVALEAAPGPLTDLRQAAGHTS